MLFAELMLVNQQYISNKVSLIRDIHKVSIDQLLET